MRYCSYCKASYLSLTTCPRDKTPLQREEGDPLLGEVLGDRYRILERIAAGGMGQVYRAAHTRIASLFAVKVLYGDLLTDRDMRARFQREAEAASCLQSRHIVRVVDFGETPQGLLYLAMELVEGESLAAAVARAGAFPVARATRVARQLARGLAHAHERGIVHRDLKPENVMLVAEDEEPEVAKILDFGIARMREKDGVTQLGQTMGTPKYMAPEQFAGSDVDARADLYALGVILFEMLAGSAPFDSPHLTGFYELHALKPPPRLPEVNPAFTDQGLAEVVYHLLAKAPADRPDSAREFLSELDRLAQAYAPTVIRLRQIALGDAAARIREAISQGAPLYNARDARGCAALYREVTETVVRLPTLADEDAVRARLQCALERAAKEDASRAAWELRYGFDDVLAESKLAAAPDAVPARSPLARACEAVERMVSKRLKSGHAELAADVCRAFLPLARARAANEAGPAAVAVLDRAAEALRTAQGASAVSAFLSALGELRSGKPAPAPAPRPSGLSAGVDLSRVVAELVQAIAEGAPAYNAGDVKACRRIYEATAERVCTALGRDGSTGALRSALLKALEQSRASANPDDAAWTLRRAFDAILAAGLA